MGKITVEVDGKKVYLTLSEAYRRLLGLPEESETAYVIASRPAAEEEQDAEAA